MLLSSKNILADIQKFGLDVAINSIDLELVEEPVIKIILRTIKESKSILMSTLEEQVADETKKEITDQMNG
jgi:hypothetical protein